MKKNLKIDSPEFGRHALRPLSHMVPNIRISPFSAREWSNLIFGNFTKKLPATTAPGFWLKGAVDFKFYDSGRTALLVCLKHLQLQKNDEVLIVKTTLGPYISSCVTKTIEKVCLWSQKLTAQTRLVLVIHEFGFLCPWERIKPYQKLGLPILEDCAYGLGSRLEQADIGTHGDYAIYSLPKYYPIPYGGVLAAKKNIQTPLKSLDLPGKSLKLIIAALNNAHPFNLKWNQIRRQNWFYFERKLQAKKIHPYFPLPLGIIPGVFWVKLPKKLRGDKRKVSLNTAGIEATEYYGQAGFYFPVHQFLTKYERQYILYHFLNFNHSS